MIKKFQLKKMLEEKNLLKVIAGMENFDDSNIRMVVNAASLGNAQAVDISADMENILWIKENHTKLIIFVFSMSTQMLLRAEDAGADVLELGNYDCIYEEGRTVSSDEIIEKTRELRANAKKDTMLCITVPGNLSVKEQADLAIQLQAAGADILQVENLNSESDYKNAQEIVKVVEIPVLLSGRLDSSKIERAFDTGVNAIGIGKSIRTKENLPAMVEEVKNCMKIIRQEKVSV